jgi:caa(3)-type oxidase subunit IV
MSSMSTGTSAPEQDHGQAHHPSAADYVRIALILALLTALEVSTYYFDFGRAGVPLLIVLMVIKFTLVVNEFMHLKYDTNIYRRLMVTGLVGAVLLYTITLVLFVLDRSFFP